MRRTGYRAHNQKSVGRSNKQLILMLLWEHGPASRVELGEVTGLTTAALSGIARELINQRLLCEFGQGDSAVGRKPVRLGINKDAGRVAGVRLQKDRLEVVIYDLSGCPLARNYKSVATANVDQVAEAIRLQIGQAAEAAKTRVEDVAVVAVASPGLIITEAGVVHFSANLGWHDVPLRTVLGARLGKPVLVENVANAAALAAYRGRIVGDVRDLIYVNWGIGIGAGIIEKSRIFRGFSGFAGELGHVAVPHGHEGTCRCGAVGCLEKLCGLEEMLHACQTGSIENAEGESGHEDAVVRKLIRCFREDTPKSRDLAERVGRAMGTAVGGMVNLFDPQAVIIGGEAVALREWLERPLREGVYRQTLKELAPQLLVGFDDQVGRAAQGAGLLGIEAFLRYAVGQDGTATRTEGPGFTAER